MDDSWVDGPKVPKIRKVILGGVEVLLDA
ncbi:hypothetical protein PPSIR1_13725 [Plesiocystis pacifica SIR-1]|uniref:Uncharacterized protein n=1 Tax=Plesiocystis pacifica SIR-1 TaxID=391625 RepID=A6GJK3_9BACT|nr:hypothetical protein PPSIR1_13725 [Plesiocystis pacifica SIR-1]